MAERSSRAGSAARDRSGRSRFPKSNRANGISANCIVDGQRRPRARLPQQGYHKVAGPAEPGKRAFKFGPGQIDPGWRNLDDVEIVVLQYWSDARMRIESIDTRRIVVRFTGDAFRPTSWSHRLVRRERGRRAHPARPMVPGSGDRRPLLLAAAGRDDGQGANHRSVAKQWLRLDGDFRDGKFVEHVVFRGLSVRMLGLDPKQQARLQLSSGFDRADARQASLGRLADRRGAEHAAVAGRRPRRNLCPRCPSRAFRGLRDRPHWGMGHSLCPGRLPR